MKNTFKKSLGVGPGFFCFDVDDLFGIVCLYVGFSKLFLLTFLLCLVFL